jgi:hypothetical protein
VESGTLPSPNVVKLDVEGFEVEVLRGFGEVLASPALTALVFEAPGASAEALYQIPVFGLLAKAGFRTEPLPPAHAAEKSVATNFLATRR